MTKAEFEAFVADEENAPPLTYSPSADALYVHLKRVPIEESKEIMPGVIVDYDTAGHVVGMEILNVSERIRPVKETEAA